MDTPAINAGVVMAGAFIIVGLLTGCGMLTAPDVRGDGFFPLETGRHWTYHITAADQDTSTRPLPTVLTVSVTGKVELAGDRYYQVINYFVPGTAMPDTVFLRREDQQVFIRLTASAEEQRLYSFTPEDATWQVSLPVNATMRTPRHATLVTTGGHAAEVTWERDGRSEHWWTETFTAGIGRTAIHSVSQAYDTIRWELIE